MSFAGYEAVVLATRRGGGVSHKQLKIMLLIDLIRTEFSQIKARSLIISRACVGTNKYMPVVNSGWGENFNHLSHEKYGFL